MGGLTVDSHGIPNKIKSQAKQTAISLSGRLIVSTNRTGYFVMIGMSGVAQTMQLFHTQNTNTPSSFRDPHKHTRRKSLTNMTKILTCLLGLLTLAAFSGCEPEIDTAKQEKKPRPVELRTLRSTRLETSSLVTAPVASWKTEQIGMEVGGRIEWVAEPNSDIEARIPGAKEGDPAILEGTPIARIEQDKFELQVKSQEAQVQRAQQAINAANIELESTIPAQIRAAEAEKSRAATEYGRSQRLADLDAGAKSDVDRDLAALKNAESQVEQLNAALKAKEAEILSLEAQRLQALDSLKDARLNQKNCTLYSSFRGQISEVSVVPGSVVSAGQAVATIQMMDPIKIEVEVSAEDSRRLRNRQRLSVVIPKEDGTTETKDGFLYLVDPVADAQTRTFTLTLLVMNERLIDDENLKGMATIDQTWRVDFQFLPGSKAGKLYSSSDSIDEDCEGPYVWKINGMDIGGQLPPDRILDVEKVRVEYGNAQLPFLGNWTFQEIIVKDKDFSPDKHLIAGRIKMPTATLEDPESPKEWEGDKLLFQKEGQWELRPGDLVQVDLASNEVTEGMFVPMDAIAYDGDKTFLFLLNEADKESVERVEIEMLEDTRTSEIVSITAKEGSASLEGRRYVSRGAHYLIDGEKVRPVESEVGQ